MKDKYIYMHKLLFNEMFLKRLRILFHHLYELSNKH